MLVFGDRARMRDTGDLIGEIAGALARRQWTTAFIAGSELVQGLADARHEQDGIDRRDEVTDAAMHVLVELARAVDIAWSGGRPRFDLRALRGLEAIARPRQVRTKRAEGFAFYAVYPEAYLAAARRVGNVDHVIGIRSIGAGLAALVAAARETRLPSTVRPTGDPFRRTVSVAADLLAEWCGNSRSKIAICDEGPGLSGSSFGAVADVLEAHGVTTERITMLPSHRGELGPIANDHHRARWRRVRREVVTMDELLVATGRLAEGIAGIVGPLDGDLVDISGGRWRELHYRDEREWPPIVSFQERRKFLARTRSGRMWLARFVGLGRDGNAALVRAHRLHAAGFTPEVAGLWHGFLIERWYEDARPLSSIDRRRLVERVGRYLALRATMYADGGATLPEQMMMLRRNIGLALGAEQAEALVDRIGDVHDLDRRRRPVEIDGRLHRWEWLVRADGTLVKADAYDHHAGHDLIGCQDITWDIAGAVVELGLYAHEERRLCELVGQTDRELLSIARPCYLAFQLGRAALAADSAPASDAKRLRAEVDRYAALLHG